MTTLQLQRPVVSASREMLAQQELARVWASNLPSSVLIRLCSDEATLTSLGAFAKAAAHQEFKIRNLKSNKSHEPIFA